MNSNRKVILVITFVLAILLIFSEKNSKAASLKIYVSVTGKDSNPGTKEMPVASLGGALNKLRSERNANGINGPV